MPSKQVWIARNPKESQCYSGVDSCLQETTVIPYAQVCVRMRLDDVLVAWHPECWLGDYIPLVTSSSHMPGRPGRKSLDLTDEQAAERLLIQKRHAAAGQKIRVYQGKLTSGELGEHRGSLLVRRQQLRQEQMWYEIQSYGGAPDDWRIPSAESK